MDKNLIAITTQKDQVFSYAVDAKGEYLKSKNDHWAIAQVTKDDIDKEEKESKPEKDGLGGKIGEAVFYFVKKYEVDQKTMKTFDHQLSAPQ